jgi:plastocyanin
MTDETEATGASGEAGDGTASESTAVAVQDAPAPPAVWPPPPTPEVEQRKERFWLPLLLPIGAILVTAFVTFNVSRIFLAASEESATPAVIIASGITLAILVGAAVISALPHIRTSSLVVGLCGVMIVVLLSGSLVLGPSEGHEEGGGGGYQEPAGEAINTLEVDALPSLRFQSSTFTVPAGINLVRYVDKGGTHTLLFENAFPGFKLAVPTGINELKVDFAEEGQEYTIYCDIPGHRQAGMEATVTVGPAAAGATGEPGTETPSTSIGGGPPSSAPNGNPDTDPADQSGNETGS